VNDPIRTFSRSLHRRPILILFDRGNCGDAKKSSAGGKKFDAATACNSVRLSEYYIIRKFVLYQILP
jgi:hypothetical protein